MALGRRGEGLLVYHSIEWYARRVEDGLTDIQRQVLAVIREATAAGEPTPSLRDLCDQFGWRSTGTARDHVAALVRKGLLERPERRRHRGLRVREPLEPGVSLPVLGAVSAGRPTLVEQRIEGYVTVPTHLAGDGHFVVIVSGDSMTGAGMLDGDQIVVKPGAEAVDGDIVVATVGGETTVKRLRRRGGHSFLEPENPRYNPIAIRTNDSVLHGVVVGLLRAYPVSRRRGSTLRPARRSRR